MITVISSSLDEKKALIDLMHWLHPCRDKVFSLCISQHLQSINYNWGIRRKRNKCVGHFRIASKNTCWEKSCFLKWEKKIIVGSQASRNRWVSILSAHACARTHRVLQTSVQGLTYPTSLCCVRCCASVWHVFSISLLPLPLCSCVNSKVSLGSGCLCLRCLLQWLTLGILTFYSG